MPLDPALEKAHADFKGSQPFVMAAKAGVEFEKGEFVVPFFNRKYSVSYPEAEVAEIGAPSFVPDYVKIVLLHYLTQASGASIKDEWIAFRMLPGGRIYEPTFMQRAVMPLVQTFGEDLEGFRRAGKALGGIWMDRMGDAAFRFFAFPRIPMGVMLYLGEEDMPAGVNMVFDRCAPEYLPTEDLSGLGGYLCGALQKAAKTQTS